MKRFALTICLLATLPFSANAQCLSVAIVAQPHVAQPLVAQPHIAQRLVAQPLAIATPTLFATPTLLAIPQQPFTSLSLFPFAPPAVLLQRSAIQRVRVTGCRIRPSSRSRSVLRIRSSRRLFSRR